MSTRSGRASAIATPLSQSMGLRTALAIPFPMGALLAALYMIGVAMTARVESVGWRDLKPLPGTKFVRTKTGRTSFVDVGEGPPVLLMHGSGRSIADWQEGAIEHLARHHRVIALDYFGNGQSERNPGYAYGYDLWVGQAAELLDVLEIAHVTVIGHSVGGALACVLAIDHPSRVDHVVTIGTGMTIEPQQLLLLIPGVGEIAMSDRRTFGPTYSEKHRAALEAAYAVKGTRAALLAYARRQLAVDGPRRLVWGTLERIRVPVLHISGSNDVNIPHAVARDFARRTHGRFVSIEGATHMVQIDAPDRLAEEIEKFLAKPSTIEAPGPER